MKEKTYYEIRFIDDVSGMDAIQRYEMDEANCALGRFSMLEAAGQKPSFVLITEKPVKLTQIDPWEVLTNDIAYA